MSTVAMSIKLILVASCLLCVESAKKPRGELKIDVLEKPDSCSTVAGSGDTVSIHYTGKLASNGQVFDSSQSRGPFSFKLDSGRTIKGFDQGVMGMCVGEKRSVRIPPHLGYGESGQPPSIPPSATLIFDLELLEVEKSSIFDSGAIGTTLSTAVPLFFLGVVIYFLYVKAQSEDAGKKKPRAARGRKRQ